MPKMVAIQYKCACMQDDGSFEMAARRFNEDIEDFMDRLQKKLSQDHAWRSPMCRATKTEYVRIPTPESGQIGSSKEDLN